MKAHLHFLQKMQVANTNKKKFLNLHYKLSLKIIETSQADTESHQQVIKKFYQWLLAKKNPFFILSTFDQPHMCLINSWLHQTKKEFFANRGMSRAEGVKKMIKESLASTDCLFAKRKSIVEKYIHLIGSIFGEVSINLFLQHFSEILEFSPPDLSYFERALQTISFNQQNIFYEELYDQNFNTIDGHGFLKHCYKTLHSFKIRIKNAT